VIRDSRQKPSTMSSLTVHHNAIYRYVLTIVGSPEEAEDLTQETFLRAHDKQSSLKDPGKRLPWLYRIATNVCYDRFRQASFQKRPLSLDEKPHDDAESPALSRWTGRCHDSTSLWSRMR
jgi:RNA polymerase sigma factor (sigma-70 family)